MERLTSPVILLPFWNSCTTKENPVSCNGNPHMSTLRFYHVAVTYVTSLTVSLDQKPRSSSRLRLRFLRMSLALALRTMQESMCMIKMVPTSTIKHSLAFNWSLWDVGEHVDGSWFLPDEGTSEISDYVEFMLFGE
ncbi:hypothetical protein TNCV_4826441 [Trichonephila clavipes]|nr:hypothetical protein TNCV_4826441 [Trichonephila clavipes]